MTANWQYEPEELAVKYLVWMRDVKQRPQTTWTRYGRVLSAYIEWCKRFDLDPMNPGLDQLERFMIRPRKRTGYMPKPATQKLEVAVLKSWFQWAVDRDFLLKNPGRLLEPPSVPVPPAKPLPDDVWIALWGQDISQLSRAALGMGYFAGMRTFEIEQTPRVDVGSDLVKVTRKGGKVQSIPWRKLALIVHYRLPHLLPDAGLFERAVRVVRSDGSHERLFPFGFENMFNRLVRSIPGHYTPHMLRHSMATNLLLPEVNMPIHLVQEMMGHASIQDTQRYVQKTGNNLDRYFPELA